MRIILRNTKTRRYLQDLDQWTENPQLALEFEQSRQAARLVQERGLKNMEVVLAFEDARYNFRLPLRVSA